MTAVRLKNGTFYDGTAGSNNYVYDGWRVIQERDGSNNPQVSYTRGNDLSGTIEGAGGIGGLLARSSGYSSGNFTTHNFYFSDGNGNITYMLNGSQSMVASYRYDPFGNTISSSGTLASANLYRFSSKEIHSNSGMYYYGYRFYDPNLQRWVNRDPIENIGFRKAHRPSRNEFNLYQFLLNDPIDRLDPKGLDGTPVGPCVDPNFAIFCNQWCAAAGMVPSCQHMEDEYGVITEYGYEIVTRTWDSCSCKPPPPPPPPPGPPGPPNCSRNGPPPIIVSGPSPTHQGPFDPPPRSIFDPR